MGNQDRTKEPIINELERLRRRVAELEESEARLKGTEQLLRESEERFRLLYENAPLGYQSLDEDGFFLEVNQAWLDTFGYSREDVIGKWFGDFLSPAYQELFKTAFSCFKASGEIHRVELEVMRKDGARITVSLDGKISRDEHGKFKQTHCILYDITEAKRSEEALRRSEEFNRRLLEQMPAGIVCLARDGTIEYVNPVAKRMGGIREDQESGFLGRSALAIPDLEPKQDLHDRIQRLLGGEPQTEVECVYRSSAGVPMTLLATGIPRVGTEESQQGAIIMFTDISVRKRAEKLAIAQRDLSIQLSALSDLKKALELCVDTALDVSAMDCAGIYLVNEDSSLDLAVVKGISDEFVTAVSHLPSDSPQARLIMEGKPDYHRYRELGGDVVTARAREGVRGVAVLPVLHEGRVIASLHVASRESHEISPEIRYALETIAAEVGSAIARIEAEEVLRERTEALERSNQDLEQFAYVAAHDLREPLVAVGAYLKLLERRCKEKFDAEAHKFLSRAVDTTLRMDSLIQSLLAYSRIGNETRPHRPADFNAILKNALSHLHSAIRESGAVVTCDVLPKRTADASQMTLLFQNLISNAIKFRGEEPLRIHVGCAQREGEVQFFVKDNGIGIEPPYFERIFRIFQRIQVVSDRPGTGIGLANCRKIVERHGGRIWVESEPGVGSTFFFTIPEQPN